jgi:PEP-CTERM motif
MKKHVSLGRAVFLATILLALPFVPSARAVYLSPGGLTASVLEADPVGGTNVYSMTSAFSSLALSGTLTSQVIGGAMNNPLGGLTFTYFFDLSGASIDAASTFTVSSFAGFQTDVSYTNAPAGLIVGGVAPVQFSRSSGSGSVVRFSFLGSEVNPGEFSALLVIQTDAQMWDFSNAALIDGQSVNALSLAPQAIPEPGTLGLLVAGLGFVGFILRRKRH